MADFGENQAERRKENVKDLTNVRARKVEPHVSSSR